MKDAQPGVPFVPKDHVRTEDLTPEQRKKRTQNNGGGIGGDFLAGYAPGTLPFVMRPGEAKLVKAGSDIALQMHYTANGNPATDTSPIGLIFSKAKPNARVSTL